MHGQSRDAVELSEDDGLITNVNEKRTILRSDAHCVHECDFRLAGGTQYCLVKDAAAVSRECSAILFARRCRSWR